LLWPNAYFCPFWSYGPDFVLASVFWPGPYYGVDYAHGPHGYDGLSNIYGYGEYAGYEPRYAPDRRRQAPPKEQFAQEEQTEACSGLAPGITDLPFDRIEQVVRPTGDQVAALDDLKSASSRSSETLKTSCPNEVPLTPVGRLDAMDKRLNAMVQAVRIVRTPLENFYNLLTEEQRRRFDAMGEGKTQPRQAGSNGGLENLCSPQAESFTQLPLQRVEESIRPTQQQQAALNDLKTASAKAANELEASCPSETPQTAAGRLDAITKRLDAMIQAGKTVRPALDVFYASLTDEQRARFNVMGQPQGLSQASGRAD
jgi:hypothetical protein